MASKYVRKQRLLREAKALWVARSIIGKHHGVDSELYKAVSAAMMELYKQATEAANEPSKRGCGNVL